MQVARGAWHRQNDFVRALYLAAKIGLAFAVTDFGVFSVFPELSLETFGQSHENHTLS